MNQATIAFIGAGNMATSLIGGLIADNYPAEKIWASDPATGRLQDLQQRWQINISNNNEQAIEQADIVIFAVKPQAFKSVAEQVSHPIKQKQPLIISIAAGITTHNISQWLQGEYSIVRCMPNTPALIKAGATGLFANARVNDEQKDYAESILRAVGITVWLHDEAHMDIVAALSGSGPAYFFYLIEAMSKAAAELGLHQDTAQLLTLQTALGAARMAMESKQPVQALRKQVTSPGGTTQAAMETLDVGNVKALIQQAVSNAAKRSQELAA